MLNYPCTQYDEADLPITRNQEFVMRNLTLDNEHRAFLTHLSIEALESVSPNAILTAIGILFIR